MHVRPLRVPFRPILWSATLLHLFWGCALVLDERVKDITGLGPLTQAVGPGPAALMLIVSAALSLGALARDIDKGPSAWTFWAFMPQQALLMASAGSAIVSGTVLPSSFIFADQFGAILLALLHPFGLLRMHAVILPDKAVAQ